MGEFKHKFVHTNGIRMHCMKRVKATRWCFATGSRKSGTPGAIN